MSTLETVLTALERAPGLVREMVDEMPPHLRTRRLRPEKWSLHEHACHLAVAQDLFEQRLALMLAEENPAIRPYLPDQDDAPDRLLKLDLAATLDRFARERAGLVARLRTLTPAQWQRSGRHPEYTPYTIYIMFRHVTLHDGLHLYRMEELLLAPAFSTSAV